ncbi:MAG: hypothetical protein DME19_05515 [Verrucomicrobia bacterium]|nr:MAG: hypothetical protein DME19_05515 [Verrucomicrobiota bacterium]
MQGSGYIRAIETGVGNQNGRRQSKDFWKLPRRTRDLNLGDYWTVLAGFWTSCISKSKKPKL